MTTQSLPNKSTVLIDYLAFTVPVNWGKAKSVLELQSVAFTTVSTFTGTLIDEIFGRYEFVSGPGRGGYRFQWRNHGGYFRIFYGEFSAEILVEITGTGCKELRELGVLQRLLMLARHRLTRFDVAIDFETEITPKQFVHEGYSKRYSSYGEQTSESGQTIYVGSQASERFARVYRYYDPHPRSKLLRVEFVFKKDYAKKTALELLSGTLTDLAAKAGATFDFQHELWKGTYMSEEKLPGYKHETKQGKTLRWLLKQVVPAFHRLVEDGTIEDPEKFLREYFLEPMQEEIPF